MARSSAVKLPRRAQLGCRRELFYYRTHYASPQVGSSMAASLIAAGACEDLKSLILNLREPAAIQ